MRLLLCLLLITTSVFSMTFEPYLGGYAASKGVDHDNNDEETNFTGFGLGAKLTHGGSVAFGGDLRYSYHGLESLDIKQAKLNAVLSFAVGSKLRLWALYTVYNNTSFEDSNGDEGDWTIDSGFGLGAGINVNRMRFNIEYEISHLDKQELSGVEFDSDVTLKTLFLSISFPM